MNLTDLIIPGLSAAGVTLGARPEAILRETDPEATDTYHGITKYTFPGVTLWVRDGHIRQIGVSAPYSGKISGSIGVGSTIAEVETALGRVVEDRQGHFAVSGIAGMGFETTRWSGDSIKKNRGARLTEIFVFSAVEDASTS